MQKLVWLALGLLIFIQCNRKVAHPAQSFLGEETAIGLNETLAFMEKGETRPKAAALEVQVKAIQDSRCPVNANCIWPGNATVRFRLSGSSSVLDSTLCCCGSCQTPGSQTGQLSDSASFVLDGNTYILVLKDVTPHPVQGQKQAAQKAIIQVTKR